MVGSTILLLHIDSLGGLRAFDDTRSASLFCMDFGFLRETDVHQTDDFPGISLLGRCAEVRTSRISV